LCKNYVQLATLPQSRPEEVFPDNPKMHKLFNHNVLWNFENLQMLIGTNLPIFRGGKYSSLSSRLRFNIYMLIHNIVFIK